jgi:hypothetical protein
MLDKENTMPNEPMASQYDRHKTLDPTKPHVDVVVMHAIKKYEN